MKNITKFFIGLLICISLITGFSNNTVKAETSVVAVQEVNSDLFVLTLLINGSVITISVSESNAHVGDIY